VHFLVLLIDMTHTLSSEHDHTC